MSYLLYCDRNKICRADAAHVAFACSFDDWELWLQHIRRHLARFLMNEHASTSKPHGSCQANWFLSWDALFHTPAQSCDNTGPDSLVQETTKTTTTQISHRKMSLGVVSSLAWSTHLDIFRGVCSCDGGGDDCWLLGASFAKTSTFHLLRSQFIFYRLSLHFFFVLFLLFELFLTLKIDSSFPKIQTMVVSTTSRLVCLNVFIRKRSEGPGPKWPGCFDFLISKETANNPTLHVRVKTPELRWTICRVHMSHRKRNAFNLARWTHRIRDSLGQAVGDDADGCDR